jgi:serine/threonine protein kinase/tetratricopeptide (TPR) repeat protein
MLNGGDRALEILADVLEAEPERRPGVLDGACAGEPALRAEVERLLGLGPKAREILDALDPPGGDREPPRFGRYRALRLIGEGGMGSVYEAEQDHPRRCVAIKVVKPGMDTRQVIRRFEAEREALARMDHPNIAKVFDAGVTDAGRPYFVMELVSGVPITDYCDANSLSVRERLELFILVCRAVQHAHQKAIIHRDVKPSNVLVTMVDGAPAPKVIDFGIAKATSGQRLSEQTLMTEYRQLVGTPQYMSPEQAEAGGTDIDTRSDIYSLGVLLYELLTGTTPFKGEKSDPDEVRRRVREAEAARPSTRISQLPAGAAANAQTMAKARRSDLPTLVRAVRGELDWIVMKCLEKDRTRRYETANALALDVRRHLDDEPVAAGPPSVRYRLGKFVRRYRLPLAGAASLMLVLVLGVIGTSIGLVRARAAEQVATTQKIEAEREAAKASAVSRFLQSMLQDEGNSGDADARLVDMLDRASAQMSEKLKGQPEVEFEARFALSHCYWAMELRPQMFQNLRRAYELVRQTGSERTEQGLWVMISIADWQPWLEEIEWHPELPDRVTFTRGIVEDARRTFGRHEVTLRAETILGQNLRDAGQLDEAEKVLREAAREWRTGDFKRGNPSHYLGQLLVTRGKLDEAEGVFREALLECTRDPLAIGGRWRLRVSDSLAQVLVRRQKTAEALETYEEALAACRPRLGDAHPEMKRVTFSYLRLLQTAGRHTDAARLEGEIRAQVEATLQLPARTPAALERRARAHLQLGQFREAIDDFGQCIALDPDRHVAWMLRGDLLAHVGDREGYEEHCCRFMDRFETTTSRVTAERTAKICLILPRPSQELERARRLANRAVGDDEPHQFRQWFRLAKGMAEYRSGDFLGAIDWMTRARDGMPAEAVVTIDIHLAMSHYQLGRTEEALAVLDRARQTMKTSIAAPGAGYIGGGLPMCYLHMREAEALILGRAAAGQE